MGPVVFSVPLDAGVNIALKRLPRRLDLLQVPYHSLCVNKLRDDWPANFDCVHVAPYNIQYLTKFVPAW